jgi:hypothetical protein
MAVPETEIVDCLTIIKHFERCAVHSNTQEATAAMFTPLLSTARSQSSSFSKQLVNDKNLSSKVSAIMAPNTAGDLRSQGIPAPIADLKNLDKGNAESDSILTRMRQHIKPDQGEVRGNGKWVNAESFGNIFNSKCIPCGDRLNMLGELDWKKIKGDISNYFKYWKQWLIAHLNNLKNMALALFGGGKYIDICAFIQWLKQFVCVPDIARILSVLMALLGFINFDINGIFDLILQLAAPLLQPILSNFVNLLQQYILLIIKPIECIIESLQAILAKLDYNVLFQNVETLDKHLSFGRKSGEKTGTTGQNINKAKEVMGYVPVVGVPLRAIPPVEVDLHSGPRAFEADVNLLGPIGSAIKQKNQEDQQNLDKAASELRAIEAAASDVNAADRSAVASYNAQLKKARENYKNAQDEKSLSEIGEINKSLGSALTGIRSFVQMIVGYLREGAQRVEAFFKSIFDELKKIMGEFFGGGGSMVQLLAEKMAIIQVVAIVAQLIGLLTNLKNCNTEEEKTKVMRSFGTKQMDMKIWQDSEGGFHIETDPEVIKRSVDKTVAILGKKPKDTGTPTLSATQDKGTGATDLTSRQKLESLIEFTGNPVLDTEIARVTEALTTPVNLVFKCPLQTSVKDAEQINTWIKQLQTEG